VSLTAVILVGGEGTRLRPLTERTPKPMLPLLDRPLLAYTFDHLARHGVERAVLSCGYLPTQIRDYFGDAYGGLAIEYRVEPEPLGTGGAIRFGAEGLTETFLAVNGDSLRGADLDALLALHRERGALAAILLTPVDDPSRYGVVETEPDGRVTRFVEKPQPGEASSRLINAGVYVLEPEVLELVPPGRMVSVEREVFPLLVERRACYARADDAYWLDVGTPASYLQAHLDELDRRGGRWVAGDAQVDERAVLGERVAIGPRARVAAGAVVEDAVVHAGASIGEGAVVSGAIVGEAAEVEPGATVGDLAVVGPGARVAARA
jgi:mannose-1-phosphate guanylyltransferase